MKRFTVSYRLFIISFVLLTYSSLSYPCQCRGYTKEGTILNNWKTNTTLGCKNQVRASFPYTAVTYSCGGGERVPVTP